MATANTLNISVNPNSLSTSNMLEDIVAPRERYSVPNHLLDTKIFSKLSQNSVTKVQPSVVHFAGYKLNKVQKTSVKISNASSEKQNIHIIPPSTKYFTIHYTKPRRFVPGFIIDITVSFVPDEWRYYYDCIRIHCKGEENLVVPLHAFPIVDTSKFPNKVLFYANEVVLGESSTKILPLFSNCPVDFEYQVSVLQSHPSLKVHPLTGVIPGEGKTNVTITFTPTEYITAHMTMQLIVSQFNSKPLVCHVTGSCSPSVSVPHAGSVKDLDELYKQTNLLDPRCLSPVHLARRKQKIGYNKTLAKGETGDYFEYEGYVFPSKIHAQHAVNSVLSQQKGKLGMKHLREAILEKSSAKANEMQPSQSLMETTSTRQMKEAAFEKIVRQDVVEERANQLRWQVHLGQDPLTDQARALILKQRENAMEDYKYIKRKEPRSEEELNRRKMKQSDIRIRRKANSKLNIEPCFDKYKNKPWTVRYRALERFQQAARTVQIRCRADKKVVLLRKMVADFNKGLLQDQITPGPSTLPFQVEIHAHDAATGTTTSQTLLSNFAVGTIKPFTFPVYVSPDRKEDIAPDALGEVPVEEADVISKREVPFHELVVPQYYHLAGYRRHDVSEAIRSYIPPGLARQLRSGAEDEIIQVTLPPHLTQTKPLDDDFIETSYSPTPSNVKTEEEETDSKRNYTDFTTDEQLVSADLIPPPELFKNPKYHRLHIFNRAPGVIRHHLPLPQSEVDVDYHLCPMPRYTMLPNANKFLDRQDVIKGVMNWKKSSSHSLNSLVKIPTLVDVWLPRWSDCFSQSMVPVDTPELQHSLSKEDEMNLLDEEEPGISRFPLLTSEMVKSFFPTETELLKEVSSTPDENTYDVVPVIKVAGETISAWATSKDAKQAELEKVIQKKSNQLGTDMRDHLTTMNVDFDTK